MGEARVSLFVKQAKYCLCSSFVVGENVHVLSVHFIYWHLTFMIYVMSVDLIKSEISSFYPHTLEYSLGGNRSCVRSSINKAVSTSEAHKSQYHVLLPLTISVIFVFVLLNYFNNNKNCKYIWMMMTQKNLMSITFSLGNSNELSIDYPTILWVHLHS